MSGQHVLDCSYAVGVLFVNGETSSISSSLVLIGAGVRLKLAFEDCAG